VPVASLHAAAELFASADSPTGLAAIARAIGCGGDPAPLDRDTQRALGLDDAIVEAGVATGPGALRALLLTVRDDTSIREVLPRIAARLATRAAHVLWIVVATQRSRGELAIAAWRGGRRPPRVAAIVVDRRHPVDSDAETLRALSVASSERDILTHERWVEVLGRDSLTARFYRALERAVAALTGSSSAGTESDRRETALLDTSRLIFLSFLEAKGWLDGDRGFLVRHFERCALDGGRFRDRVLRPLFFGTLNTPMRQRARTARAFGRVPFLNGGLFARTPLERKLRGLALADDAYGSLIFDVFGQFRFTAREETATWVEAAVDPEMLGRAFESLMAPAERRRTGAFFTPFSLVERVSTSALAAALGEDGARALAGEPLPAGLRESDKLEEPIFSPATKAEVGHDENVTFGRVADALGTKRAAELRDRSLALYGEAQAFAATRGVIIADTKFEFGRAADGRLVLIDEVLTPDSSRFWPAAGYRPGRGQPSFDKQPVRDYLDGLRRAGTWNGEAPAPPLPAEVVRATTDRYREIFRRLTESTMEGK